MSSEHTIQPAPLPPSWQQRATAISSAATDTYVLARANLVGHEPYDLHALHEGLRGIRARLHEPHPALLPEPGEHTPEPPPAYRQAVARFSTALATAARHERAHHQLDTGYRAELAELADAAHTLLTGNPGRCHTGVFVCGPRTASR